MADGTTTIVTMTYQGRFILLIDGGPLGGLTV